jgi:hypothetical protein
LRGWAKTAHWEEDVDLHELSLLLEQFPGAPLLKSDHAPFLIDFFKKTFLAGHSKTMPYSDLCKRLKEYIDATNSPLKNEPSFYVDAWVNDKNGYLRKYCVLGQDEPVTELSEEMEQIIVSTTLSLSLAKLTFTGESSIDALFSSFS